MWRTDRLFFGLGIVAALAGMLLGLHMAGSEDFTLSPVHAHVNLVGWVSMALFGLAYRAGIARNDRWARVHFWVAAAGTVVMPIGIAVFLLGGAHAGALIGSLLTLASMLLFGVNVVRARNDA
jgi:cbb3-type cytochrome oxidase subunit 1